MTAPGPPAWLKSRKLPLHIHEQGSSLYRVHRIANNPVFFGPGDGKPPANRFDSDSGAFGVLYVAPGPEGCLIETLLRTPAQRIVASEQLDTRAISVLHANRDLRLVEMIGANLSALGTTGALNTGAYTASQVWTDALFTHPDKPDGILYTSRHNPDELCIALFERAGLEIEIADTKGLIQAKAVVAQVLNQHGKSLSPKSSS